MDRLYTGLARAEEALPGFRVEIVEGSLVASPVTPHHGRTIHEVWKCLEGQIGQAWALISGVGVPFDDDNEFCPDLAVIPAPEAERNESAYLPDLIELVVEVVSRGSVRRDTVPYGPPLTVDSPLGKLKLTTDRLPVEPGSRPHP